jgi:outer membrane protein OmpA-like peptidoglycan-associated protein
MIFPIGATCSQITAGAGVAAHVGRHNAKEEQETAMTVWNRATRAGLLALALGCALSGMVRADALLEVGNQVLSPEVVRQGLFPEEACAAPGAGCKAAGRGVVRYSLSAAAFRVGSAELPDGLRDQLAVFAEVLRGRAPGSGQFAIESHADASSSPEQGKVLSQRRADAVKSYLVRHGVNAALLVAVGRGAQDPRHAGNPYAAQNRRIVIARVTTGVTSSSD